MTDEQIAEIREALAKATPAAALKARIYNGEVPLTGPELLLLCDDLAAVRDAFIAKIRARRDEWQERVLVLHEFCDDLCDEDFKLEAADEILAELEGE
jgi:hypothetical protein